MDDRIEERDGVESRQGTSVIAPVLRAAGERGEVPVETVATSPVRADRKRVAALRAFRRRLRPLELRAIAMLGRVLETESDDPEILKVQLHAAKLVFEHRHGPASRPAAATRTIEATERRTVRIAGDTSAEYITQLRQLRAQHGLDES